MELHDFLYQLVLLVITFAIPVLTTVFVKYYREKGLNEKFKKYKFWTDIAVSAIEQTMGGGNGAQKKREVELWLSSKLKGVSADEIDKLVQAAVSEMNKTLKKEGVQK